MVHIAIVGIGGIFPSTEDLSRQQTHVDHLTEFWQNIQAGRDCAREVPADRWLLGKEDVYGDHLLSDKVNSMRGCFLQDTVAEYADFDLDPDILAALDPMFHILLQAGLQAWRDIRVDKLNKQRVGVIIGNIVLPTDKSSALAEEYLLPAFESQLFSKPVATEKRTESLNRYVAGLPAGLLAKALGLGGGSYTLDAACASSLYALKYAVDELVAGRADAMLTGGLSRPDCLYTQMGFSALGAISKTGRCAPFDQKSDGLLVGEGAGILVLKRLSDALRDQDHIYATIAGIGLSNDIAGNLMSPDTEGQMRAMRSAYEQAGWSPDAVDLIECHGTGTPIGDAVEFNSLCKLWSEHARQQRDCVIGSVKSNIGHLLTAAGSAGIIKTLLAMKHQILPPTANFSSAATNIDMQQGRFRILSESEPWQQRTPQTPRRAAVSAFGFGGINAHVLLEEWQQQKPSVSVSTSNKLDKIDLPGIAIVGMEAQFGPWKSLATFRQRLLYEQEDLDPDIARHWRGVDNLDEISGWFIDAVDIPVDRYRIPPAELKEMLPQQLLMLEVAGNALRDAGIEKLSTEQGNKTGTFIGIGLDLNSTNFHFRWSLKRHAESWCTRLGIDLKAQSTQDWLSTLLDAAGPPLNANRTMGALGGIVASRITRAFGIGGPGFTVSNEESSGLRALELAVRSLQRGELDMAIVGAVDLAADPRAALAQHARRAYSEHTLLGEGAVACILKRDQDAQRDGDRVYAVVSGMGASSGGGVDQLIPTEQAYRSALAIACNDAGTGLADVGLLEAHGSGYGQEDAMEAAVLHDLFKDIQVERLEEGEGMPCVLGSLKSEIGHSGAASGLAAIARASLCLYHKILPRQREQQPLSQQLDDRSVKDPPLITLKRPQYWLANRVDGYRNALVNGFSVDGNCLSVMLREAESPVLVSCKRPVDALFEFYAPSIPALLENLQRLRTQLEQHHDLQHLSRLWWQTHEEKPRQFTAAIVVADRQKLIDSLEQLRLAIENGQRINSDGIYFSPQGLGEQGKLAFVYPGTGSHFPTMGLDLGQQWPQVLERSHLENDKLASQFANGLFWRAESGYTYSPEQVIFAQVCLGSFISDILTQFHLKTDAVIGYSLGESAGIIATRTWRARDIMLHRIRQSDLFTNALSGNFNSVRHSWHLNDTETVDWMAGIIHCSVDKVQGRLATNTKRYFRVYLMIINTAHQCMIGGDRAAILELVAELDCAFHEIPNVLAIHCEVAEPIKEEYRYLHLLETHPPKGVTFYSASWGKAYQVTRESVADSIVAQAIRPFDYPQLIESAYADGVRLFIEMGPGSLCSRMIDDILHDKPHLATAVCVPNQDNVANVLHCLGQLIAERVAVDLSILYPALEPQQVLQSSDLIKLAIGATDFNIPSPPLASSGDSQDSQDSQQHTDIPQSIESLVAQIQRTEAAKTSVHETFLRVSNKMTETLAQVVNMQLDPLNTMQRSNDSSPAAMPPNTEQVLFDRETCIQIAVGSIGDVLGEKFADIDQYPSRVRLPAEPLMLVDRVVEIDGRPDSLGSDLQTTGSIITEHDILPDSWYLDGNRIPTCIAVEAGQADLFLSGYLGIDHITHGQAFYRLLDARVVFHDSLPEPGETIRYQIYIQQFFKQDETYLFRFHFEGSVANRPLLSMTDGCAGFFTQQQLDDGQGIVQTKLEQRRLPGKLPQDWQAPVAMQIESYSQQQLDLLRQGDLRGCFGDLFAGLKLNRPVGLPAGRMELVHRILKLDPNGGRFGIGQIIGEADIHPDDWFLVCHFSDDPVMPGTLMYECCLHTLRVYLLRMGWVGEEDEIVYQPVVNISSQLKCRGQVIASTQRVQYEITLKEIGYQDGDGRPYVLANALISADSKVIVQMDNMSLQISGLNRKKIADYWCDQDLAAVSAQTDTEKQVLFDTDSIYAFAMGKPSEAFGDRYKIFDQQRKIARLPGPPYQLLDRIVAINDCQQWQLQAGGIIEAEYDVPQDAWYFQQDRQTRMPFAVLLEIALQPCGWLAAYLGSALLSDVDLSFRNLGGTATQKLPVTAETGTLSTRIKISKVAQSGGMIIQNYDMEVRCDAGIVYQGHTYFGFFSKQALQQQIGIRGASLYDIDAATQEHSLSFPYPDTAPYPDKMMRMIDEVTFFDPKGGTHGLGFIRGKTAVDAEAWFFKAHFYQDPVWPGSLGLESMLQLLKVFALGKWGKTKDLQYYTFESMVPDQEHQWIYRGQIVPQDKEVIVEAVITEMDAQQKILRADGFLSVDGRIIYQMTDFTLRIALP